MYIGIYYNYYSYSGIYIDIMDILSIYYIRGIINSIEIIINISYYYSVIFIYISSLYFQVQLVILILI